MSTLTVGISDLKISSPPDILVTYALGSCVGICLLDQTAKVGGLLHIMLPSASVSPGDKNILKFADTALPEMVKRMEALGAKRARLQAKIAGGAQMFGGKIPAPNSASEIWSIGQRNVNSVIATLTRLSIPIIAKDVFADYGRTVFFNPATGIMTVKALSKGEKDF